MLISPAQPADVEATARCLTEAFAGDPLLGYLFVSVPERRADAKLEFLTLLLEARIALGMPVLLAREDGRIRGAVMGYSTSRPDWPRALAERWARLESSVPGLPERMADYEAIAAAGVPGEPHYYLGVMGTDPSVQGRGVGGRLLEAFCALSIADPASHGVYLETATPANLPFYRRAGFVQTHQGALGAATLWCLFLSHDAARPRAPGPG